MANVKISNLPAVSTVVPNLDVLPLVSGGSTTKATPNSIISAVLLNAVANTNPILIGLSTAASSARFPQTLVAISNTTGGNLSKTEAHNIGLLAEGTAHASDANVYGIGLYGKGYTSATTRCGGVVGEGHVTTTTDVGSAIGIRGYSNDTHSGGLNVGLYGDASGSTVAAGTTGNNLSLYLNNGDIYSNTAKTWYLNGNLTFNNAFTVKVPSFATTTPSTINAATYTVSGSDTSLIFTTTNNTLTLPAASSYSGRILFVKNITANSVTSATANVVPIGSATAGTPILVATIGKFAMLQSDGTNWITMMAN